MVAHNITEEWRPLYGWETSHQVSNLGRIRSIAKPTRNWATRYIRPGKLHAVWLSKRCPYLQVTLQHEYRRRNVRVHHAVAEAFIGPCPKGMECNHKDGKKHNNRSDNLEWVTKSQNTLHAIHHFGARRNCRNRMQIKLSPQQIPEIRKRLERGEPPKQIAPLFGVTVFAINDIRAGRSWTSVA
jgi:hypothetical protein